MDGTASEMPSSVSHSIALLTRAMASLRQSSSASSTAEGAAAAVGEDRGSDPRHPSSVVPGHYIGKMLMQQVRTLKEEYNPAASCTDVQRYSSPRAAATFGKYAKTTSAGLAEEAVRWRREAEMAREELQSQANAHEAAMSSLRQNMCATSDELEQLRSRVRLQALRHEREKGEWTKEREKATKQSEQFEAALASCRQQMRWSVECLAAQSSLAVEGLAAKARVAEEQYALLVHKFFEQHDELSQSRRECSECATQLRTVREREAAQRLNSAAQQEAVQHLTAELESMTKRCAQQWKANREQLHRAECRIDALKQELKEKSTKHEEEIQHCHQEMQEHITAQETQSTALEEELFRIKETPLGALREQLDSLSRDHALLQQRAAADEEALRECRIENKEAVARLGSAEAQNDILRRRVEELEREVWRRKSLGQSSSSGAPPFPSPAKGTSSLPTLPGASRGGDRASVRDGPAATSLSASRRAEFKNCSVSSIEDTSSSGSV